MQIVLAVIAGYVAVNLLIGNGPRWNAITLYWVMVTIKNVLEVNNVSKSRSNRRNQRSSC